MIDPMSIMTVREVAEYLRIDEASARRLLERGDIPNFEVAGQPRVQYGALVQWFQSEMQIRSLKTLRRELEEPSNWQRALEEEPELRKRVQAEEYEEGTLGSFLKSIAVNEKVEQGDSVSPSSPGARDVKRKGPLIFICHSSKDKSFVRELVKRLRGDGVECWVDELEIRIGDSIHQKINDGLARSDFFSIVLSTASVKSRWVNEELASASTMEKYSQSGVLILPILIEDCDIPPLLLDRRYANFKDDPDSAYKELLDSILHHFERRHPEVSVEDLKTVEPPQDLDKRVVFDLSRIQEMPPRHFEDLVAGVLQDSGYTVELTPLTRDGGYDIVASRQSSLLGLGPERILVQCKRWRNPVGIESVRELVFLKSHTGVSRVVLVTTSRFTSGAKRVATQHGVDLVDGEALGAWMQSMKQRPRDRGGS